MNLLIKFVHFSLNSKITARQTMKSSITKIQEFHSCPEPFVFDLTARQNKGDICKQKLQSNACWETTLRMFHMMHDDIARAACPPIKRRTTLSGEFCISRRATEEESHVCLRQPFSQSHCQPPLKNGYAPHQDPCSMIFLV